MRVALLDGDTLVYAAASSTERAIQWSEWLWTLHSDLDEAVARLDAAIARIEEALGADRVVVALSDEARWRPAVMPGYKHHRTGGRKPVTYAGLREYLHETREVFQRPTLEGDDVLGILATSRTLIDGEKIIVAIDKDLRSIPGQLYHYERDELVTISPAAADHFHLTQTLTGDATDGYPGCPGIGPKKAEKLLAEFLTDNGFDVAGAWLAVVAAYENAGLTAADALTNARVARICRASDYDFKNKKVKLWTPPT